MNINGMEVFQQLTISPKVSFDIFRSKLINNLPDGWNHDLNREGSLRDDVLSNEDVIVLHRKSIDYVDESLLILWQNESVYSITNIIPCNIGELGVSNYNIILDDFVEKVIIPLEKQDILSFTKTTKFKGIDDWFDTSTAVALKLFSRTANKTTGIAHPLDRSRWIDFIIKAHKSNSVITSDELLYWLTKVEDWPFDEANELVINYEFSWDLLSEYDKR
ncbi:hypothetical protein [Morganella morganii]|uniref:hypothetical protein n=1 Tax=Morganella morganii TaxID=582 RepID=UPI0032DBC487